MSSHEELLWVPYDPIEETERVDRHLGMARVMLDDLDDGESTVCKISFSRIIEENGMQTLSPGEHTGVLLGIDDTYPPKLLIGAYAVHLTEVDDHTNSVVFDIQLDHADMTLVPVREISELFGATGTVDMWQYLEDRDSGTTEQQ